jgi:argininosuccinate synthase
LIEDRFVGLKVRGVYENPAATILIQAHKNLEKLVSTREENELKTFLDTKWAYLTYAARWFDPVMENINAFINKQNEKVT